MANDTPPKYVEVPFSRSLRMAAMIMHDKLALAEPMVPPVASAIVERGHCLNHDSEPGVLSARIATAVTAAAAVATTQPLAHALLRKISAMAKMAVEYTTALTRAYISHVKGVQTPLRDLFGGTLLLAGVPTVGASVLSCNFGRFDAHATW